MSLQDRYAAVLLSPDYKTKGEAKILYIFLVDLIVVRYVHGAELQKHKLFSILAHSRLPEEDWTFGGQFNNCRKNQKKGRKQ